MKRRVSGQTTEFCLIGLLAFAASVPAQKVGANTGPSSGGAVGTAGIAEITGTRTPWGNTSTTNNNSGTFDQTRPIFLSGNVMFDDGRPPNGEIRIERVCGAGSHMETHTDSKGHFSFQVGSDVSSNISDADAANNNFGSARSASTGLNQSAGGMATVGASALMGCELRASYPGYISETVDLSMHRSLDDPKLGTILLHRLGNVRGTTISVTTAQAPKSAQKSYEKGYELVQKGRFEEAEGRFVAAITDYPKFAVAWFALGQVQHRLNKSDEAKRSYLAAAQADSHYLSPFDQLALLSAEQGKWEDAAKYSKQVTDLNPVEFPSSFWYSALANYNLKNDAEAEKSAQALIKLDSRRRFPQAETMLAEFAENRGDLKEAAAHLQAFLSEAPNSPNADVVKQQLSNLEEARATAAKSSPALAH